MSFEALMVWFLVSPSLPPNNHTCLQSSMLYPATGPLHMLCPCWNSFTFPFNLVNIIPSFISHFSKEALLNLSWLGQGSWLNALIAACFSLSKLLLSLVIIFLFLWLLNNVCLLHWAGSHQNLACFVHHFSLSLPTQCKCRRCSIDMNMTRK